MDGEGGVIGPELSDVMKRWKGDKVGILRELLEPSHKVDAKYVMQDRRGLWYYSSRKPRPKEGDWTPNKTSIACRTEQGYVRALKTDTERQWLDTCQRTVRMVSSAGTRRPAED